MASFEGVPVPSFAELPWEIVVKIVVEDHSARGLSASRGSVRPKRRLGCYMFGNHSHGSATEAFIARNLIPARSASRTSSASDRTFIFSMIRAR